MKPNKTLLLALFLGVFIYCCLSSRKGPEYFQPPAIATHPDGGDFVGSATCMECHADIYTSHQQTAHYHTSAIANEENIKGSLAEGSNIMEMAGYSFEMVGHGKDFYQRVTDKQTGKTVEQAIDIVVGSGVKGQSYLTWQDEHLFQLQTSYYPPADRWINSPGYPLQLFERPIRDGCLKCHTTFAKNRDFSGQGNHYDATQIIYGVDCERCHRPAAQHVAYHRNNPDVLESKFMLKLDTLPRQLRLDVCAQCHSGPRENIIRGNSFSFLTGQVLREHSRNSYTGRPPSELDVHGNQYGLLASSQCFIQTPEFDCGTCHDPHTKQRGMTTHFNQKCAGCHQASATTCTAHAKVQGSRSNNCIACHMPNSPSEFMTVQLSADSVETPVYVRTHLIGIYPEASWHY